MCAVRVQASEGLVLIGLWCMQARPEGLWDYKIQNQSTQSVQLPARSRGMLYSTANCKWFGVLAWSMLIMQVFVIISSPSIPPPRIMVTLRQYHFLRSSWNVATCLLDCSNHCDAECMPFLSSLHLLSHRQLFNSSFHRVDELGCYYGCHFESHAVGGKFCGYTN